MDNYNDGLSPDYYSNQLVAKGFKQSQHLGVNNASIRPRAISVGMLEDPARVTQRNLSALDQQAQNLYGGALLGDQNSLAGSLALAAGSTTLNKMPQANITAANRYISGPDAPATRVSSYLAAPTNQGRSLSPKTDGMQAQQMQVPTRSLWIGNLDNSVTSEQLIHVFAPYGAIESLRLLPEKVSKVNLLLWIKSLIYSFRNVVSSTLWTKKMQFALRMMYLIVFRARLVCKTVKLFALDLARPKVRLWLPQRVHKALDLALQMLLHPRALLIAILVV